MQKEQIEKEIEKRIGVCDESLKYLFDALCEMKSDINTISYLMFLKDKFPSNTQKKTTFRS